MSLLSGRQVGGKRMHDKSKKRINAGNRPHRERRSGNLKLARALPGCLLLFPLCTGEPAWADIDNSPERNRVAPLSFGKLGSSSAEGRRSGLTSSAAMFDKSLDGAKDPRGNLRRLVDNLGDIQGTHRPDGNLSQVVGVLTADDNPVNVRDGLRNLLPEVGRHTALRERKGPYRAFRPTHRSTTPTPAPRSSWSTVKWLTTGEESYRGSTQIWVQTWVDDATQDDAESLNGFDSNGRGFTLGIDQSLTPKLSLSLTVGAAEGNIDSNVFGEDDLDSDDYSIYLNYAMGKHNVSLGLSRALNETERDRIIIVSTPDGPRVFPLQSEFDSEQQAVSFAYSSSFEGADNLSISPFLGVTYAKLSTDDYIERGGGDLNLSVVTDDESQLLGGLGVTFSWALFGKRWLLSPSISAAVEHDFKSDSTTTFSHFRDTPIRFTTQGYDIERTRWRFGAGIGALFGENVNLNLSYQGHRKGDYTYDSVILSLQLNVR